jgi:hypothetical protein
MLVMCLTGVASQAADNAAAERDRIARERALVEAKARVGEAACAKEFAVAACTKAVRAERRGALQQLDRQRALLDDAQRKLRAAERLARIRERQDAAARGAEKPAVEVKMRPPSGAVAPRERSEDEARAEALSREQRSAAAASAVQGEDAKAARRAAAARKREQDAAKHREQVERRNRERAASKPPAAGLSVPPASSPAPTR